MRLTQSYEASVPTVLLLQLSTWLTIGMLTALSYKVVSHGKQARWAQVLEKPM